MRVSELISKLEKFKKEHGDVLLYAERDDGRSSWVSPANLSIEYKGRYPNFKDKKYVINVASGY